MTPRAVRTVLFWSHLVAGVIAGAIILIMSVTGALLTYERQLIEWSDRGFQSRAPTPGADRLSLETLLSRVRVERPGDTPTAVTLRSRPEAPATVTLGQKTVYVDTYTGRILGEPTTDVRQLMSSLRAWHRWLAMGGEGRALGKAINGWSNVAFLLIVLSGMYLWLPRKWTWQSVRSIVLFRGGLRGKARDFNWHNVIGIWSAIPLAIVVATAMPISFSWANALVYRLAGEAPPAPAGGGGGGAPRNAGARREAPRVHTQGLDALWAKAARQVPDWRSINLRFPTSTDPVVAFAIDRGNGGQPQLRSTLTLDVATGDVVRWETFEDQSLGRRLRSWSRFAHTGEYYGLIGQTIAGLVTAGGAVLVWTGIALALRRFLAWSSRNAAARAAAPDKTQAA